MLHYVFCPINYNQCINTSFVMEKSLICQINLRTFYIYMNPVSMNPVGIYGLL